MRTISLKLSDTDYETLSKAKGDKTISDYIRALIAGENEGSEKETETLRTILSEVALIRNELLVRGNNDDGDRLVDLAKFVVEIVRLVNPPAIDRERQKVEGHLEALRTRLLKGDERK